MKGVVDILTSWRIDTANEEIAEISTTVPTLVLLTDGDLPIVPLRRKTV
jgi:hypothetical protein